MVKSQKSIPLKNYFVLAVVLVGSIFLIYYLYLWVNAYKENKLNDPIMNDYLQVINYNELESYLYESESTVVYVSVVGDDKIRSFENKFKDTIIEYSLKNKLLYMDVSDIIHNNSLKYGLNYDSVPCILVFDGIELVKTYNLKDINYDFKKVKKYLITLGIIDEN